MSHDDLPPLEEIASWSAPLTSDQLNKIEEWLGADWESHDALDSDARSLVRALIETARFRE